MKKETINDMTVGKPLNLILQFMIPVCLGNLFQQFYNVADSVIAGQFIGVNALAAVGSTGSLMFFVTGWLNGLSSGFAIIVSQMFGAKKFDRMRHYVAMSVYLMAFFAIFMTIGFSIANVPILHLMNSPKEVFHEVTAYMEIIYMGLIVTAAYNSLAAFLRALGDSRSPLYFLIISAVINVVLDIVFIIQFGMGVEGCAWATVIAQGISAVCCLVYIIKRFPILHLKKEDFRVSFKSFGRLLNLGIPMGLQFSITAIGTIIVQSAVNVYGPVYMAGFSAAGKIQNIFGTVYVAFGATIATYVGQNRGAGRMDRVKQGVFCTQIMIFIWSAAIMVMMFFFGKYLVYVFLKPSETDVIQVSVTYFKAVFWAYPFLGSIFLYRNTLQGMGYGLVPMLGGVFELVARTAIVLAVAGRTSFKGVCLADPAAWIAALVPLVPYYLHVMKKYKNVSRTKALTE
ncbi:MAG: MATE family efflux transporter [Blautia sp.]|nr:MATE family efflux transporter [Blautia sp.]